MPALLAFDTATEQIAVALSVDDRHWLYEGAGGAQASATLLPSVLRLLDEAGLTLAGLDAIAFGRGPGAFTGLRTACSVAQGLAFGAGKPVLPIDTLLAVAEEARSSGDGIERIWVACDARMGEVYAAHYEHAGGTWRTLAEPMLLTPEALNALWAEAAPQAVAGNALDAFGAVLYTGAARCVPGARPTARALLPLALAAWRAGRAVDAAEALPLYVRDKVAQTTTERAEAAKARP